MTSTEPAREPSGRDDARTGVPCTCCGTSYRTCTDGLHGLHGRACCGRCAYTDTHDERRDGDRLDPDDALILWRWAPTELRWVGVTTPQPRALLDAMLAGITADCDTDAAVWAIQHHRPTTPRATTDPRPYRPLATDTDARNGLVSPAGHGNHPPAAPAPTAAETQLLAQLTELPAGARVVVNVGTDGPAIVGPDRIAAGIYRLATDLDITTTSGDQPRRRPGTIVAGQHVAVHAQKPADQRADIMRADGTSATAAVHDLWAALEAPQRHDTHPGTSS